MNSIHIIEAPQSPCSRDLQNLGQSIASDWFGASLTNPASLIFWISEGRLHFITRASNGTGLSHPGSHPGQFHAGLWKYDVAEFFLSDPATGRYLEFNLAPNGAWWSCGFSAPRIASPDEPSAIPGVQTHAEKSDDDSWQVHASLPLDWLQEHYNFGPSSRINATFILNSPNQIFLTAAAPSAGQPDFHRPHGFLPVEFRSLA